MKKKFEPIVRGVMVPEGRNRDAIITTYYKLARLSVVTPEGETRTQALTRELLAIRGVTRCIVTSDAIHLHGGPNAEWTSIVAEALSILKKAVEDAGGNLV